MFGGGILETYFAGLHIFKSSVEILDRIYRDESVNRELPTLVQINQLWKKLNVEVSTWVVLGEQTQHRGDAPFEEPSRLQQAPRKFCQSP